MKKILAFAVLAMLATATFAQTTQELVKEKTELNSLKKKLANLKPTKATKQLARQFKAEGWKVMIGDKDLDRQILEMQAYKDEPMIDANGLTVNRFYIEPAQASGHNFNVAFTRARNQATTGLAKTLKEDIAVQVEASLNSIETEEDSKMVDELNQKSMAIANEMVKGAFPVLVAHRENNGKVEVQVQMALDKAEMQARVASELDKQPEGETDEGETE